MRCPKCGTENAPDSRFCGVCGAMQPSQRLAPTAKISDDAPIAAPTRPVQPVSPAVSYAPPSMPPPNQAGLAPPQNQAGLAPPQQAGLTTKPGGHAAPPRPSGEQQPVRPSGPYGQVQPRASSQPFDSVTPTAQNRKPTPVPGSVRPSPGQRPANSEPAFASRGGTSGASMSFSEAPPSRSLGLIAIVLFIDLGLAGSGAFLLSKGLAKPEATVETKKDEKKTEAPTPVPAANTAAAPSAPTATPIEPVPATATAPAAGTTPAAGSATAAETAPATAKEPAGSKTKKTPSTGPTTTPSTGPTTAPSTGPTTSPSAGPVTSPSGVIPVTGAPPAPQPPSTQAEINALATRSAGGFARCKGEAALAGTIDIAFQVQPDGSVANAAAVENTTGNAEVSGCLARVISGWRVSPFQGNTMSFVRSFSYP